jgi:hypothetical protein
VNLAMNIALAAEQAGIIFDFSLFFKNCFFLRKILAFLLIKYNLARKKIKIAII